MSAQTIICDPETGLCTLPELEGTEEIKVEWNEDTELIYVGDPMCSWCWGISPQLFELEVKAAQQGIPFRLVMGGLRPGGGDPWNKRFKGFLNHHWEEVHERSGQPFNHDLLTWEAFEYDTEPACRAVVVARDLAPQLTHQFYEYVQHHFYVQNQDPKTAGFYKPICEKLGIDFERFQADFTSEAYRVKTRQDFVTSRSWGVSGYPSVLLRQGNQLTMIARGYSTFEKMWTRVEAAL